MSKIVFAPILVAGLAASFVLAGCSHTITDANGNNVTTDLNGTTTYKGANGETATVSHSANSIDTQATDKNGNVSSMHGDQNGMTEKSANGDTVDVGGAVSEDDLGVPFYPGSADTPNGGDMKATTAQGTTVQSVRTTTDDPDKVIAFYTGKLGKPDTNFSSKDSAMAAWKQAKRSVVVSVGKGDKDGSFKVAVTVNPTK